MTPTSDPSSSPLPSVTQSLPPATATAPEQIALAGPAYSRYVARCLQADPALAVRVAVQAPFPTTPDWLAQRWCEYSQTRAEGNSEEALKRALRQLRREVMCILIERDLSGQAELAEVTETMTSLAELCIREALAWLEADLQATYGLPMGEQSGQPQPLLVVGMGKLGGRELNVSSDIDLIFLYEEEGETQGGLRSLHCHEYFTRMGRRLINMLADVTADGFVFRVDMRLRPNGDAGPLVCSLPMLEDYLMVQGREWERYAWIKARVVSATDSAAGQRALKHLTALTSPFVFRRYLDYGVIASIRELHAQIRAEAVRRDQAGLGKLARRDIKLGSGGIREIEFIAQVFQLIRGGQDFALRARPTLEVLACIAERGLLPGAVVAQLSEAYGFLRRLEHRLQYLDDAQTHNLPESAADQALLATSMGLADYATLLQALAAHQQPVIEQFEATFSDKLAGQREAEASEEGLWGSVLEDDSRQPALQAALAAHGLRHPEQALAQLRAARQSARYRQLSDASRRKFDQLIPRAIALAGEQTLPDDTLSRFLALFETISRRASYLSLLCEYPHALARLAHTLSASRWAANYLIRHPQLLDELLGARCPEEDASPVDYWQALAADVRERLGRAGDNVEQQMDLLRQVLHAETFRILLQDLQGAMLVEHVSDRLSALADTLLQVTIETVWQQFPGRHKLGKAGQPRFAIIAYGKLGGKELGYGSDLDLIFLYHEEDDREGSAAEVYAAFARRLLVWLTSHTSAGTLFDVDTRLRPDGAAGLLVTDLDAFRAYQLERGDNAAWVWEQQALSRARFCAGDAAIGEAFEAIRDTVLRKPRDAASLRAEVCAMRTRVLEGHQNKSELFDLKHDRGGMVDIEFTVQYLVLLHSRSYPELTRNIGNIALLHAAGRLELIDAALAGRVADAYRIFRARQHVARLDGVEPARAVPEQIAPYRQAVLQLWQAVMEGGEAAA